MFLIMKIVAFRDKKLPVKNQSENQEKSEFFYYIFLTLAQSIYKDPYDLLKVVDYIQTLNLRTKCQLLTNLFVKVEQQ